MIWYDVSELKDWQGHYTGIQRVISEIGKDMTGETDIAFCFLDRETGRYRSINYEFASFEYDDSVSKNVAENTLSPLRHIVGKMLPQAAKVLIKRALSSTPKKTMYEEVDFGIGDTLFLPGAFWIYPFDLLNSLKLDKKLRVVGVMYDLVPIIVPQYTAEATVAGFNAAFGPAVNLFDKWLAISENTKRDLLRQASRVGVQLDDKDVEVFVLGSDITKQVVSSKTPPAVVEKLPKSFSMMVSTIEARKNQSLIYQAIKLALSRNVDVLPVVLVGKHGWLSDDLVYMLRHDKTIKDKIIWLERIDDEDLGWLYGHCKFTIYSSFYEGWGLPVAESLSNGIPCIASSNSSIPEIAGDVIDYFSPHSPDELLALMKDYASDTTLRRKTAAVNRSYVAPTWSDATKTVLAVLRQTT